MSSLWIYYSHPTKHNKLRHRLLEYFDDYVYRPIHQYIIYPVKSFFRATSRGFRYFKHGYTGHDYRWSGDNITYHDLAFCLQQLYNDLAGEYHRWGECQERTNALRRLKICIALCNRFKEGEYVLGEYWFNRIDERYYSIETDSDGHIIIGEKDHPDYPKWDKAAKLFDKKMREQKEYNKRFLFNYLEKYIERWWD